VITDEGSGKPPSSVVACSPPTETGEPPSCEENHLDFEDFLYGIPKDMDLLGNNTDWRSLGITNDWWLGFERCADGVGPLSSEDNARKLSSNETGLEEAHNRGLEEIVEAGTASNEETGPSDQDILTCIFKERRNFMQEHMRLVKLKADVAFSQTTYTQRALSSQLLVLLGSMQVIVMLVLTWVAIVIRQCPCIKKDIAHSKNLYREYQKQYVGKKSVASDAAMSLLSVGKKGSSVSPDRLGSFAAKIKRSAPQAQQDTNMAECTPVVAVSSVST